MLFSASQSKGLSIPYPHISLHALQRPSSLYLQIVPGTPDSASGFDDHDPDGTISLTITPQAASQPPVQPDTSVTTNTQETLSNGVSSYSATIQSGTSAEDGIKDELTLVFEALSACANLHPDLAIPGEPAESDEEGDDEGVDEDPAFIPRGNTGLPLPMPCSGGWITADNVGQFFDQEGNWTCRQGDAAVIGRVRRRSEDEGAEGQGLSNGGQQDGQETNGGEETKWRRTG